MIEEWLVSLGARIVASIHADGHRGYAEWGPARPIEWGEDEDPRDVRALWLRYDWTTIHVGWGPSFDRWANSLDWEADVPESQGGLERILAEALRLGDAGDRCEMHDFKGVKIS